MTTCLCMLENLSQTTSCQHLVNAKEQIEIGGGNELISFDIREAMRSLTEIIGTTSNVDILNNIFSKFCIGK